MRSSVPRRLADAAIAGGVAGILAGGAEGILLETRGLGGRALGDAVVVALAASGLGVPLGVVTGLFLWAALEALPKTGLLDGVRRLPPSWIYATGVVLPLLTAALFHVFLGIGAHVRDSSLAALGSMIVAVSAMFGALGLAALIATKLGPVLGGIAAHRRTAVIATLALWAAIGLPGFFSNPDDALRGSFGFIALLRKDTLDYTPVIIAGILLSSAGLGARVVGRLTPKTITAMGAAVGVFMVTGTLLGGLDSARPLLLEHATFTGRSLRAFQKAGDWDGDGFSRWLGGGDCDDGDPRRHPGAREIRGNGIDEDCDGEDLPLAGPARTGEPAAIDPAPIVTRPSLPDDLSFLLITVDALRPDLGFLGYERHVSPNLDEFATRSIVYEKVYSISTYTGFSLPPMMASRYPSEMPRTDRHEVKYAKENVLLAERLRDAGFHTAGAASHFLFHPNLGWVDGFDRFVRTELEGDAPPGSHDDLFHSSRGLADAAIQMLADPEITSGPFFMWFHFMDPHKQYLEHPGFSKFGDGARALYDGEVAFTDHHIGRVLRALAASRLAPRTVVIVTADHGEAFGEHGIYFHGWAPWDEIVRVPLVVYLPGATPRRIKRAMSLVEIAPTILDLAGLTGDPGARGQSFAPELFGGDVPARPILIDQPANPYYAPKRAFVEGSYKLHHAIDSNSYRLFDLAHDPGEKIDLAATEPDLLARVKHSYAELMSDIDEVEPTPVEPDPGTEAKGE